MYSVSLQPMVLSFVLWIFTSIGVMAQNGTVLSLDSLCNPPCPSGFHCFNNTIKTTVIEWGHNGHICDGQTAEECYGETDPFGRFERGPRQIPQTVVQGDTVIFKPVSITINVLNVSRDTYHICGSDGQLVQNGTSSSFQVPSKYLNPTGIKYFITTYDNFNCNFGIKLELYVRSRQQPGCINPATPNLGVCSGAGLCASDAKTFFTRNYSCLCCNAYKGSYCEELDSCDASRNPCKNGATCTDLSDGIVDSFNCSCVPGYKGTFCETNINECDSGPCQNGAFCSDSINSYTCLCTPGFEGVNCDITIPDLCADNPCANGGTCLRSGNKRRNYTCSCLPNFTGRNCTVNITSSSILVVSTTPLQSSMLFSTSLMGNSTSFATAQESSSLSVRTTRLASTVPITSPLVSMRTSTSEAMSLPTPSSLLSSVSLTSKVVTSLSQSLPNTVTSNLVSFSSAHTTFDSSLSVVSSSKATLSSVLLVPTSISSTFSQAVTSSMATSESLSLVTMTTESMESVSSRSALTSSFVFISSTSTTGPSPSPDTSLISSSSSSSLSLASSPVLTSTTAHSTGRSSEIPSLTMLPSTMTSTSSITTTLPSLSTVYYTSTIRISPSMSTVLVSSSVMPTMPPTPTIPPLINQTCLHNPCNNGTCFNESYVGYEFRCECPHPTFGPVCTREFELHYPSFDGKKSFLEYKSISFNNEENCIDITFQTNASEGLLLFASDHKERGDFIQLRVVNGKVEFRFDTGDSLVYILSNERVDTGETVTVTACYVSTSGTPFGTLQVDNGVQLKQKVNGRLRGIQLYDEWYVGGVRPGLNMLSKTKGNAAPSPPFSGSIKDVQVNGETISFTDAVDWLNINEGDMPACQRMPCGNNGVCIPHEDNVHDYTCNCTEGYKGRNCDNHIACQSENCNGGECIPKDSNPREFVCLCPLRRVGVQCQTVINITVPLFTIVEGFPSFLEYPVPRDAVKSFHVRFQFKLDNTSTSWNDSLLVYSAQNKFLGSGDDLFAVGLKNNTVLLQYNLGSGSARIYSEPLDPGKEWHSVVAGRDGRDGWLKVDNQLMKTGESKGSLVGLNLFEPFYIGGIPSRNQLPSILEFKTGGFHGSMYDVAIRFGVKEPFIQLSTSTSVPDSSKEWAVVKGRNVGNESYDECSSRTPPCSNGGTCKREGATYLCSCPAEWAGLYCTSRRVPCYGYDNPCVSGTCRPDGLDVKCDCPLGKTGQLCNQDITIQTPLFKDFSYMLFKKTNIRSSTQITIKFKPSTLNGILFYVAHDDLSSSGDFLSIILHNGFVKLRYDLGKGVGEAKSNATVSLNTWYTVKASRTAQTGNLTVNDGSPVSVTSPGSAVALDVNSHFYLGGVRMLSDINSKAVDNDPSSVQDFSGCIDHFEVNGILYFQPNTGALEGRNIANCPDNSQHAA